MNIQKKHQKYMSCLLKKCFPENYNGRSYSWKEFERRHKIVDYLFNRKFPNLTAIIK